MSRPARPSSAKAKSPDAAGESRASTAALRAETLLDVVTRAASGDYDAAARAAAAADAAAAG